MEDILMLLWEYESLAELPWKAVPRDYELHGDDTKDILLEMRDAGYSPCSQSDCSYAYAPILGVPHPDEYACYFSPARRKRRKS